MKRKAIIAASSFLILQFAMLLVLMPEQVKAVAGQWSSSGALLYYTDGNVGVGTNNPLVKLDVQSGSTSGMTQMGISHTFNYMTLTSSDTYGNAVYWNPASALLFGTGSTNKYDPTGFSEKMRIAPDGKIGIGTNNPESKLNVRGTANNDLVRIIRTGSSNNMNILDVLSVPTTNGTADASGISFSFRTADESGGCAGASIGSVKEGDFTNITTMDGSFVIKTAADCTNYERMRVTSNGNVGIGTSNPQSKLAVNGTITAKEVVVTLDGWADYVFDKNYNLMDLPSVEKYIKENNHLPNVPSEKEIVDSGVSLGDMQKVMMRKVEELTLYTIQLQKENDMLKARLDSIESRL